MLLTAARLPRRSLSPLVRKVHEQQVEDIMVQLVQQARTWHAGAARRLLCSALQNAPRAALCNTGAHR